MFDELNEILDNLEYCGDWGVSSIEEIPVDKNSLTDHLKGD